MKTTEPVYRIPLRTLCATLLGVASLCFTAAAPAQVTIFQESFETAPSNYSVVGEFLDASETDFFFRTNSLFAGYPFHPANPDGLFYFVARDTATTELPPVFPPPGGTAVVTFVAVDVAAYENLEIRLAIQDADGDFESLTNFPASNRDFLQVFITEGGATTLVGQVTGTEPNDNALYHDIDFDGVGDIGATATTSNFTDFVFSVPGNPSNLSVIIKTRLDFGSERLAFDNLRIQGILATDQSVIGNQAATLITSTSAVLNATFEGTGATYQVEVLWGPANGGTNAAAWANRASYGPFVNQSLTNLAHLETSLTPNSDFFFTWRATNATEDLWARPTLSFSTPGPPAVNNAGGATAVTPGSATLNGELTAGNAANAWMVWGDNDPGLLNTAAWDQVVSLGTVNEGAVFSTPIAGLAPLTNYFYRSYVTNEFGSAWSAVTNFTTPPRDLNLGFESPALGDGSFSFTPLAWSNGFYDLAAPGVWMPGAFIAGAFNPDVSAGYGGFAPEGTNAGFARAAIGFEQGLYQVLPDTLQTNRRYDLTALIGNPIGLNGGATADYRVELLAGGTLLYSNAGPSPIDDTFWTTSSLTFYSGPTHPQVGQALEIRLLALEYVNDYQVDFDEVRLTIAAGIDTKAPTPDPMTFAMAPEGLDSNTVVMTADLAADISGPVEYYFENLSNGIFSGWSTSPVWTNTGLTEGASYGFRVRARDRFMNETAWSLVSLAIAMNETNPPLPNPMAFNIAPTALDSNTIVMSAVAATDQSGPVEYYFENISNAVFSGWSTSLIWTNTGLSDGLSYGFRVQARDQLGNTGAWSTVAFATPTSDPVNIMTNNVGDKDSWNVAGNWSLGHVPNGPENVVIAAGILASVENTATPMYDGTLTIQTNAILRMLSDANGGHQNYNSIVAASSATLITLQTGARIYENMGFNTTFPPIFLAGSNTSMQTLFGASDWDTTNLDGAIDGSETFTFVGFNGHEYNLNASNSFNELIANAIDRYIIRANVAGSLGHGDVTINPRIVPTNPSDQRSAVLIINAENAMAPGATLTLNGNGWDNSVKGSFQLTSTRLVLNQSLQVGRLVVDGVELSPGTYGATGSGADTINDTIFAGNALLTVGGGLAISKSVSMASAPTGAPLTYTINVVNLHTGALGGIVVTDALPAEVSFVSSSPPADLTNGSDYVFNIGTLEPGSNVVITMDVSIVAPAPAVITNLAYGMTTNLDTLGRTARGFAETTIAAENDILAVTKTASAAELIVTNTLTYTITVTNVSFITDAIVQVTDTFPAGLDFLSAIPPADQTNGNDYIFNLGLLPARASTSIVVEALLTATNALVLTNQVTAVHTNGELNVMNNTDTAITFVNDFDGDGLSNPFDSDDDGEGFPDCAEFIAGTDPLDPTSFLWLRIDKTADLQVRQLRFPGATGRTYRVQGATNLYTGPWLNVQTNIMGLNGLMDVFRTNTLENLFYRIGVEQP